MIRRHLPRAAHVPGLQRRARCRDPERGRPSEYTRLRVLWLASLVDAGAFLTPVAAKKGAEEPACRDSGKHLTGTLTGDVLDPFTGELHRAKEDWEKEWRSRHGRAKKAPKHINKRLFDAWGHAMKRKRA